MMLNWFKKSPVETKASLAEPDEALIELFTGIVPSGLAVSAAEALAVPAVSAAIRAISEACMTLVLRVMRSDEAGKEVEDSAHAVAQFLRGDVNGWTSRQEFIRDLVAAALMRSEGAVAWVNRVDGRPIEALMYRPGVVAVEFATDTGEPTFRLGGRSIPTTEIIHVRGPFSRSALSLAADAIGLARTMETYAGKMFKNGARPSGIIEFPKNLGDEALVKMKAGWRAAHEGPDNAGRTAILWDGATFRPITMTATDSQFLELRTFQILEIARAFRVPPSMLFELERATWSNSEQMGREFLTYTLEPWLQTLEASLARGLFTREERRTYRLSFDRDDLTRADIGDRAAAYSSLISSKVLNPNEARRWEGLPAYEGGEVFSNPNITADDGVTA